MAFREHTQRAILEICDLRLDTWDTDYISDNWEQQYGQLHCDGDSIRNSCDVFNTIWPLSLSYPHRTQMMGSTEKLLYVYFKYK